MPARRAETTAGAREWLARAAARQGDPDAPPADGPYWQALALRELGEEAAAGRSSVSSSQRPGTGSRAEVRIPYFATSLPTLLLFDDDLTARPPGGALPRGAGASGPRPAPIGAITFRGVLAERPDHLDAALRFAETTAD